MLTLATFDLANVIYGVIADRDFPFEGGDYRSLEDQPWHNWVV